LILPTSSRVALSNTATVPRSSDDTQKRRKDEADRNQQPSHHSLVHGPMRRIAGAKAEGCCAIGECVPHGA
jgi:hypothetical protein